MSRKLLLQVKNLSVYLDDHEKSTKIVDGVDLRVHEAETVGLIGPTGAGKTVAAKAILRLLEPDEGRGRHGFQQSFRHTRTRTSWRVEGQALYDGKDLLTIPREELDRIRGSEISMIVQKPRSSLHPMLMVGYQTGEPVEAHKGLEREEIERIVVEHLGKVELPDAERRRSFYPHQFSGGEAQRIMIAMAIICGPSLLVADEPTSDLDATIQRQVLQLLKRMKEEYALSMLMITHDLGVVAEMSDYVYVMYAGRIVEHGDVHTMFREPCHPYTTGLMGSVPRIRGERTELTGIPGNLPQPPYDSPGCPFHPRCEHGDEQCESQPPAPTQLKTTHFVFCHKAHAIGEL